ncbi:disease resistance protein (CC-NBS-LRR class) family protein [Thalictrum thalictroides]|uniref:Disease resistance protein (CC-NBS-LRR class) family protein n=1 Tax=Thalictrum thalictroides TaxID=46969 RepID=A0A7J6WTG2_THATH|nr:disease resistance protein (CC-NBS-LRR class) family protein [Thalictrum thalictroides]
MAMLECLGSLCAGIVLNVFTCSIKHLNYLHELEQNLDQLREKFGELNALRNDVKNSVDAQVGRMMTNQVKQWLQIVDARGLEVNQILSEGRQHLDRRCLNGCCPKNCWSSYKLGKQVAKKLSDVDKLLGRGVFPVVAMDPPPSRVQRLPEDFTQTCYHSLCREVGDPRFMSIPLAMFSL